MLTQLTPEEHELEQIWKSEKVGVLTPLNPGNMPLSGKAVVFTCFDARYFSQWYRHMAEMAGEQQSRKVPELFPVTCGGTPLVVAPDSPIHERFDHHEMIKYSLGLLQSLGCKDATILGHYPCLAGKDNNIGLLENVALLVSGKRWLKSRGMNLPAILFDLKHNPSDACEPWHLSASAFETWCRRRHPEMVVKYPTILSKP